jgi:hypothetical protein
LEGIRWLEGIASMHPKIEPTPEFLAAVDFAEMYLRAIVKRFGPDIYNSFSRYFCEMAMTDFPTKYPGMCRKLFRADLRFKEDARNIVSRMMREKALPPAEIRSIAADLLDGKGPKRNRGVYTKRERDFIIAYLIFALRTKYHLVSGTKLSIADNSPEEALRMALGRFEGRDVASILDGADVSEINLNRIPKKPGPFMNRLFEVTMRPSAQCLNSEIEIILKDIWYEYFLYRFEELVTGSAASP